MATKIHTTARRIAWTRGHWVCILLTACSGASEETKKPSHTIEKPAPQGSWQESLVADRGFVLSSVPQSPASNRVASAAKALKTKTPQDALDELNGVSTDGARLIRARAWIAAEQFDKANKELGEVKREDLAPLVALERARLALAQNDDDAAVKLLLPLLDIPWVRVQAVDLIQRPLAQTNPKEFVKRVKVLENNLNPKNPDARSLFLEHYTVALRATGDDMQAAIAHKRRLVEEAASTNTPKPKLGELTPLQQLERAEALLEAHRNEWVLDEVETIADKGFTRQERCRLRFTRGFAARKLRKYPEAEEWLAKAMKTCTGDYARRAAFLHAKVVSIRDGLRAIKPIERFAKQYAGHSMVDDVLFWAGDLYQRRDKTKTAEDYYTRIEQLPKKGDYCAEARWRLGWMAYRRGDLDLAVERLKRILVEDGCVTDSYDPARAAYWLGAIYEQQEKPKDAASHYAKSIKLSPLGFYAQLSLKRLGEIDKPQASQLAALFPAPSQTKEPPLCPGELATSKEFRVALQLVEEGLLDEAAVILRGLSPKKQEVIAGSHAASMGVDAKLAESSEPVLDQDPKSCGEHDQALLLVFALDRAGAYHEAHWRLRTDFRSILSGMPRPEDGAIWRAAYPLAFRKEVARAEEEATLPPFLLQALAREESALDPQVVSWAGAYGLTQLLLSSARAAGRLLEPDVKVSQADDLLEPTLNARLGGALLGHLYKRYGESEALALAAYNAGESVASVWQKRHANEGLDVFAEEMTIRETRSYVKRVLRTYGIYRWLYDGEPPVTMAKLKIPPP